MVGNVTVEGIALFGLLLWIAQITLLVHGHTSGCAWRDQEDKQLGTHTVAVDEAHQWFG